MEQEIRKTAVKRYLKGESPKSIYTDLGSGKPALFNTGYFFAHKVASCLF